MSSREYKGKRIVLWPSNIDSTKSLSQGRKIPLRYAVPNPSLEEIVHVAEELGLNPEIEEKAYPRDWWVERRRIVVDKIITKRKTLIKISMTIRKLRETQKR